MTRCICDDCRNNMPWDFIWDFGDYRIAYPVTVTRTYIVKDYLPVAAGQVNGAKAILEKVKK